MKIKAKGAVGSVYSTATGFTKAKREDGGGWKQVDLSHRTFMLFSAGSFSVKPMSHRVKDGGYALF